MTAGGTISICDVQNRRLEKGFKLTRVGVTGVKKPIRIKRNGNIELICETLGCDIDVFVDLPSDQKGSHLSRNLEIIREIVDDSVREPVSGVEDLAIAICRELLKRHEYASVGEAHISANYFKESRTPDGKETLEFYRLMGGALARRNGELTKTIGVEVTGMTACPCAMESIRSSLMEKLGEELMDVPIISHNQRNICTLMLTLPENITIEANDLIDLVEDSFSSPTYEILKRSDEAAVVVNAHKNPKFVEDVVRDVLTRLLLRYPDLPDDTSVVVRSESEESIHKHNAFAERITTLGELRL
ncbi:MAG: cyclohydrolase [Candidatus Methanomethylophilaceae archaeon]|nr:cyclohydrolase [Candidatus Methanomethylophilaceae archaeon]MDI3541639.1 cyclohydrolase [Candidatus Methanomethylophilaceae archaeon]